MGIILRHGTVTAWWLLCRKNGMIWARSLCVRVKEDQDRDFIARLKADSEKLYRVGNVFIADVRSFDRYPS